MQKQILFIHGAGGGSYEADKLLVASLQQALGPEYSIHYPAMPDEENAPYALWKQKIAQELATMPGPVLLIGHSVGASMILKFLSETELKQTVAGIFLIANPFWGGDGWRYEGYEQLELLEGFATRLPESAPIFLYHSRDDEVVPFAHLALYAAQLPQATIREFTGRNHQFNNDLSEVATDIQGLGNLQES